MTAYKELIDFLHKGEEIEQIVFGKDSRYYWEDDCECKHPLGVKLSLEEAKPFMQDWSISGGYGGEEVIYFYAWTNQRVLYIGCYDGATWLTSVPRNPINCMPDSTGGG